MNEITSLPPPPPPDSAEKLFDSLHLFAFSFFYTITQRNFQHVRCSSQHDIPPCSERHLGRSPPRISSPHEQ